MKNSAEALRFEGFAVKNGLITEKDRILVALSGGVDSVFLFYMLLCLREKYKLHIEVFHLDHSLRSESASDAEFVKTMCSRFGVRAHIYKRDISAIAKRESISAEQAGRNERYAIISELEENFDSVTTAHHADDNAETLIMHLIRGSGIDGLCGIPLKRGKLIRPLLCFDKSEISDFISRCGIPFVQDESNFENVYFRNRVRNEILPLIKKENASFSKNVLNLNKAARDYTSLALALVKELPLRCGENFTETDFAQLASAPSAVKYAFIKDTACRFGVFSDISEGSVNDIYALLEDNTKTVWDYFLHSLLMQRRYDKIIITKKTGASASMTKTEQYEYPIKDRGVFVFAKQGFGLRLGVTDNNFEKNAKDKHITLIDYDKINSVIILRNRREGDKFFPIGIEGTKSLKRFFIDRKVPKELREQVPVIADGDDIVCILGYETDRRYMITPNTRKILKIEYFR